MSITAIKNSAAVATGRDDFHKIIIICILALLLVSPFFIYPAFVMKVMCFALFAMAFNLLLGYGGLLSFGHAAYFGTASYVTAHAAKTWGLTPELAILCGTAASAVMGVVFGAIAIRRLGIYFAMITLALAQLVYFISFQTTGYSGGEDGIQQVPRGHLFGLIDLANDMTLYYVVLAVFMFGLLLIYRIVHSPFGQICIAIRENEDRATSLGYSVTRYKHIIFVLSATLAGLAGSTKVIVFQLASLTDVYWTMSGEVLLMTLVGGLGTVFGPIVGALVVVGMQNYLVALGTWVTVIQGGVFILCVSFFREGLVGVISKWIKRPL